MNTYRELRQLRVDYLRDCYSKEDLAQALSSLLTAMEVQVHTSKLGRALVKSILVTATPMPVACWHCMCQDSTRIMSEWIDKLDGTDPETGNTAFVPAPDWLPPPYINTKWEKAPETLDLTI